MVGFQRLQRLTPDFPVPIIWQRHFNEGEQVFPYLLSFLRISQLRLDFGHILPIIRERVFAVRTLDFLRRVGKGAGDLPGYLFPFIFRHGVTVRREQQTILLHQRVDPFDRFVPFPFSLCTVLMPKGYALRREQPFIVTAIRAAVFAVDSPHEFFPFLGIGMIQEEGIDAQPLLDIFPFEAAQHLVHFIQRDEMPGLRFKVCFGGKTDRRALHIYQMLINLTRMVIMETKDVTILGVSGEEIRHFFFQHVHSARLPQQLHHGFPFIRKC